MTRAEQIRQMALRFGPVLAENNKREQEALQGYYALLNEIDSYCYDMSYVDGKFQKTLHDFWQKYLEPLRSQIEEFISDELNHAANLHALMVKFGNVKEAKE